MSQIYLEKCNICFIPFIALKRNILENSDFVLLKEDIHRFISSIELFLRDIRGLRYADLKKVNFFAGHPVLTFLLTLAKNWRCASNFATSCKGERKNALNLQLLGETLT